MNGQKMYKIKTETKYIWVSLKEVNQYFSSLQQLHDFNLNSVSFPD